MIGVAKRLSKDIENLRMLAVASDVETRLVLEAPDPDQSNPASYGGSWRRQAGNLSALSTSWEDLPIDAQVDGNDDERGEGLVSLGADGNLPSSGVGLAEWDALTGPGNGNAESIVFSPRGWVTNPATDFDSQGYITLRIVNKVALGKGIADEVHVRVARSGFIRLESTLGPEPNENPLGTGGSTTNGS
jgi:hypothetical protein